MIHRLLTERKFSANKPLAALSSCAHMAGRFRMTVSSCHHPLRLSAVQLFFRYKKILAKILLHTDAVSAVLFKARHTYLLEI
jgi:hypothetical protein